MVSVTSKSRISLHMWTPTNGRKEVNTRKHYDRTHHPSDLYKYSSFMMINLPFSNLFSCYTLIYINHFRLYHNNEVTTRVYRYVFLCADRLSLMSSHNQTKRARRQMSKQHHLLKPDKLKTACKKFMLKQVEASNCIGFHKLAILYQLNNNVRDKTIISISTFKELLCKELIEYISDVGINDKKSLCSNQIHVGQA